jgi:hypothetical protein
MNIYEIIRWGNESDCEFDGGPDGSDTCFIVRADNVEDAAKLADVRLKNCTHERVAAYSQAAYLIGTDAGDGDDQIILRGPYYQHAYRYGWRMWERDAGDGVWYENAAQ